MVIAIYESAWGLWDEKEVLGQWAAEIVMEGSDLDLLNNYSFVLGKRGCFYTSLGVYYSIMHNKVALNKCH